MRLLQTTFFTRFLLSLLLAIVVLNKSFAGDTSDRSKITIANIAIDGNKKTKSSIIYRELGFSIGDSATEAEIDQLLVKAKQQLINTSLFLTVDITRQNLTPLSMLILITVKERWYIFPSPVFSLADENFNLWWKQQRRSLDRINYGIALAYENVTGHNDNLAIGFQTGYTKACGIFYNRPNIGKKQQHEIAFRLIISRTREVNYASMFDRKSFFKSNQFIRNHREGSLSYTFRKNLYTRHTFTGGFMQETVADTITKLNPSYLGNGKTSILYPEFTYRFSYNNTNNLQYPLKGKSFSAELMQSGIGRRNGLSTTQLKVEAAIFIKLFKKTYFNTHITGKLFLPGHQPFILYKGLGYNDKELFRGLDEYVLDGNAYGIVKTNLKRELFTVTPTLKFLPKAFRQIPLRFFVKGLFDAGYVNNPYPGNNMLLNRWLFTKGIGLDIVSFYDVNVSFEYSFNQIMERGLFFRVRFGL
ncbi:MAG: POTRA domain-containing protein [Chitinophagaceae bacterium]